MIDVEALYYRYPGATSNALTSVDWHLSEAEFAIVSGESGSGKSTLLRCLNGLIPHFHGGRFSGRIHVAGRNTRDVRPRDLAATIGTVFQDPETQLIAETASDEIRFALENLPVNPAGIGDRVDAVIEQLSIEHLRDRAISTLSGGERQMIALAAALVPEPAVLVLDEPTSQLDPTNATTFLAALQEQNLTRGLAVAIAEHRLDQLSTHASSWLYLADGRASRIPAGDDVRLLNQRTTGDEPAMAGHPQSAGEAIFAASNLWFSYGETMILRGLDITLRRGETVALTGRNGSGKTTLLKHFIGLLRPDRGTITVGGIDAKKQSIQNLARTVGYVGQQPTLMLHQETVVEELAFTLDALGRSGDVEAELVRFDLSGLEERHPLDLSGGQRQRLAIAAITVARPDLLVLDEPTRGLSRAAKLKLAAMLRSFAETGRCVIVATHDQTFIDQFASRCLSLCEGQIVPLNRPVTTGLTPDQINRDVPPVLTQPKLR